MLFVKAGAVCAQAAKTFPPPVVMTNEEDHRRLMKLLDMTSIRPGVSANNRAPNWATFLEFASRYIKADKLE